MVKVCSDKGHQLHEAYYEMHSEDQNKSYIFHLLYRYKSKGRDIFRNLNHHHGKRDLSHIPMNKL